MKLSTQALALAAISTAAAQKNVTLTVESSDSKINGQGLNPIHFGAGINGVLLNSGGVQTFTLNTTSNQVSQHVTQYPYTFSQLEHTLVAGVTGAPYALAENGYLTVNGSDSVFYACTKLDYDPYNYLGSGQYGSYGVGVYSSQAPSVCSPIKIKVADAESPIPSSSIGLAPSTSPISYANSTATVSVTKYTTIPCTGPTTVTYNSKTYTVTSATTLTVEDCGCTNTPGIPGPTPSVGGNNTTTPVVPANGASKIGLNAAVVAVGLCYFL